MKNAVTFGKKLVSKIIFMCITIPCLIYGWETEDHTPSTTTSCDTSSFFQFHLLPVTKSGRELPQHVILTRIAYQSCYAPDYKISLWTGYIAKPNEVQIPRCPGSCFKTDPDADQYNLPFPKLSDYKGSHNGQIGFDRGHQAPDATIKAFGEQAQAETYYLSNMTPQYSLTNQGIWNEWEAHIRTWSSSAHPVHVITGPIFYNDQKIETIGSGVAVPHAYYCICTRNNQNGNVEILSFVVENKPERLSWRQDAKNELVPVKKIEDLTGIDLLRGIPDEDSVEAAIPSMWKENLVF
jgi:endonuclease G